MRHSSWRANSRFGTGWLGVSALATGRVLSALVGGVSVAALPAAMLAVDVLAVELALAEKSPNPTTTPVEKSAGVSDAPKNDRPANDGSVCDDAA